MGGAVGNVTDNLGLTSNEADNAQARKRDAEANDQVNAEKNKLDMQKKAIEGQKKAEQQELNAKKKRLAYQQSGASGLINFSPENQVTSILG